MKRMGYETKRKWYGFSFILPWLIGCTLFFILPLIQTFGYAFQSLQASPTGFTATDVGWLNFENLFFKDADIKAQYIPYNGSNQTLVALLGKNLDVMVTSPSTIRQHVAVGDIRILAVSTSARVKEFPEVPTCKELGYETIDDFLNFRGYFVKPGTPEDVLKVLDEAFKKAYHDPEYQAFIEKEQLVLFYKGRPEVGEYFNKFVAQAEALIKGEK